MKLFLKIIELEKALLQALISYRQKASPETLAAFAKLPADDLPLCHLGLGLYLRNNVLLPDSKLYKLFIDIGITHPDDMSAIMIRFWHQRLNRVG